MRILGSASISFLLGSVASCISMVLSALRSARDDAGQVVEIRWRASVRATIDSTSTESVISSAPTHAKRFQSSYGLIANWKITDSRLAIGALRSLLQN